MKTYRAFGAPALLLASVIFAQLACAAPLPNAWQVADFSIAAGGRLSYTNYLSPAQQMAATNSGGGFTFSVRVRFVGDLGSPAMMIGYGLGSRRFLVLFDLDSNGDLTANLEGAGTYSLTSGGTGTNFYHTHTIQFNPTTGKATYVVDGQSINTNWTSSATPLAAGQVFWGSGSSAGQAVMNFHKVTFEVVVLGVVASYDGGVVGDPNPVAQGWMNDPEPPPPGTGAMIVAPDSALLPLATTLAADQITADTARLNGLVNPAGSPALAWFEWGTSTNYGNSTTPQSVGSKTSSTNLATVIGGLVGADYHFRSVISNMFGTVVGGDQSFTQPRFVPITISNLPGVYVGSVAWCDYNNDGRLDFLLTGTTNGSSSGSISQLWRNTGVGFSNVTASVAPGLPGVWFSSVAWGDYDNDGRLDFLLTGYNGSYISQLWRNTGVGFSNVTASVAPGLPGVYGGSVAWGDYDNDGRLDFLFTGTANGFGGISQLWRNTGVGFSNVTASVAPGLPGVWLSSVAWGDYDHDGRLDFLLTGDAGSTNVSQLWRNTGVGFSNVTVSVAPGLPGVSESSVAWGDYDNDGRLDFLLTGGSSTGVSQLWRNTGGGFSNVTASVAPGLPGVRSSSVAWGDYDHDGRLDFLLTGVALVSQLWRNTGVGFSNVTASIAPGLPGVHDSSVAWGDYDNDGRLDFLLTGDPVGQKVSQLWRNNLPLSNEPPAAPTGLSATTVGTTVSLKWNPAADDLTPGAGLNYNLRIGTAPGASDVLAPMAFTNGLRLLPALGNAQTGTNALFLLPPGRTYYWSVQALDTGFAGSPFATEQQFTIGPWLVNLVSSVNGSFEFYFTNQSVLDFEVLVFTNAASPLANWSSLGPALPLGGGLYRFTDSGAIGQSKRFYMLREQ